MCYCWCFWLALVCLDSRRQRGVENLRDTACSNSKVWVLGWYPRFESWLVNRDTSFILSQISRCNDSILHDSVLHISTLTSRVHMNPSAGTLNRGDSSPLENMSLVGNPQKGNFSRSSTATVHAVDVHGVCVTAKWYRFSWIGGFKWVGLGWESRMG